MIDRFKKFFYHTRTRLFVLFMATLAIPIAVTSIVFSQAYNKALMERVDSVISDNHQALLRVLNRTMENANTMMKLLRTNEKLNECLDAYNNGIYTMEDCVPEIGDVIRLMMPYYKVSLPEIAVFGRDGEIIGGEYLGTHLASPKLQDYIMELMLDKRYPYSPVWYSDLPEDNGVYVLQRIYRGGKNHGIIALRIKKSEFYNTYYANTLDYGNVYLIDRDGGMISSLENSQLSEGILEKCSDELRKVESVIRLTDNGEQVRIFNSTLDTAEWHLVSTYDIDKYTSVYRSLNTDYISALIGCVMISILLSFVLSRRFTEPIESLNDTVKKVARGDLSIRADITSNDEIGELANEFNKAIDRINELMDRLMEEQESKRKADINSLQAQINPHFISNTLTSIRYLVYAGNREEADMALTNLNKIVRYALTDATVPVTVNFEIDQLRYYINILQMGMDTSFEFETDIDPAIGNCLTMKLLFQPIIENAILHGLKANDKPSRLVIRGREEDGDLIFEIQDNGVGFDVAEAEKRQDYDRSHMGERNVHRRIRLHYGEPYGLHVESTIGIGTTVTLRIPKRTE